MLMVVVNVVTMMVTKEQEGRMVGGKERESGRVTKEQEREGGGEIGEEWEGLGSCSYF
jgi:hypothetical protein